MSRQPPSQIALPAKNVAAVVQRSRPPPKRIDVFVFSTKYFVILLNAEVDVFKQLQFTYFLQLKVQIERHELDQLLGFTPRRAGSFRRGIGLRFRRLSFFERLLQCPRMSSLLFRTLSGFFRSSLQFSLSSFRGQLDEVDLGPGQRR